MLRKRLVILALCFGIAGATAGAAAAGFSDGTDSCTHAVAASLGFSDGAD